MRELVISAVLCIAIAGCGSNGNVLTPTHGAITPGTTPVGGACTASSDCSAGLWCASSAQACPRTGENPLVFTAGPSTCQPNCSDGSCACATTTDCGPHMTCVDHACKAKLDCSGSPTCPSGCTVQSPDDQPCPVCVCPACA